MCRKHDYELPMASGSWFQDTREIREGLLPGFSKKSDTEVMLMMLDLFESRVLQNPVVDKCFDFYTNYFW